MPMIVIVKYVILIELTVNAKFSWGFLFCDMVKILQLQQSEKS